MTTIFRSPHEDSYQAIELECGVPDGGESTGSDTVIEFEADAGDLILLGIEFIEEVTADLERIDDEAGESETVDSLWTEEAYQEEESFGFLGRGYRIARRGWYRLKVSTRRAKTAVVRLGKDMGNAVLGRGEPTRTTCFVCSKTVSVVSKSVLASQGICIPSLDTMLDLDTVQDILDDFDADGFIGAVADRVPGELFERIYSSLERVAEYLARRFSDADPIPSLLRDPVGWAAKKGCQGMNLCAP